LLEWVLLTLTIIVIIGLGIFRPEGLVLLLALSVALEISSTWYPDIPFLAQTLGIISLSRLTTFAIIIVALVKLITCSDTRRKLRKISTQPLTWALILYLLVAAGSYFHSIDQTKTLVESMRLSVFIALYFSVILIISHRFNPLIPFKLVNAVGLALAPLTFYQAYTGNLLWQEVHVQGAFWRINATFVDPNIFARFLVLAIASNLILQYFSNSKSKLSLYTVGLFVLVGELVLTMSRGGILTLGVVILFLLVMLRSRRVLIPAGIMGVLGLGAVIMNSGLITRFLNIKQELTAPGSVRMNLIKAGIDIFENSPTWGVGLGGFQKKYLADYLANPTDTSVSLSHTSAVTIAAELGWIGIISFSLIGIALIHTLYRVSQSIKASYVLGIGYFSWIIAIFISSQMEARFFEDPMLWLSMGMLVALVINAKEEEFGESTVFNSRRRKF